MFYDTPHLFFNTRFANNPPWGAQITISNPAGGWADPYLGYPGGNPFPALNTGWATQAFPAFGVYVNAPMDIKPTSLQQWNVSAQRQFGDWMLSTTYLGNKSIAPVARDRAESGGLRAGATTGNTNQRRVLILQNPVEGQFYGTIGQVDDTGRGNYHGLLLSAQRRLKNNLSVLTNWTLSKCMSDPATTEITGPTIVDPNNPDLDYCVLLVGSPPRRSTSRRWSRVAGVRAAAWSRRCFGDWQFSPLVRWQSGNRSSVTTGVDNALTGMGGQRAVQVLDDPYGDGTPANYLNRAAFTSPAAGTYSPLAPFTIVNPSRLQNDLARDAHVQGRAGTERSSSAGRSSTSSTTSTTTRRSRRSTARASARSRAPAIRASCSSR